MGFGLVLQEAPVEESKQEEVPEKKEEPKEE